MNAHYRKSTKENSLPIRRNLEAITHGVEQVGDCIIIDVIGDEEFAFIISGIEGDILRLRWPKQNELLEVSKLCRRPTILDELREARKAAIAQFRSQKKQ